LKPSFLESGRILLEIKHMLESKEITKVDFAVAYLSAKGYEYIEPQLVNFLSKGGNVRFIVGLSNAYITESAAIEKLSDLANTERGKNLKIKYHKPSGVEFHPKIVLAKSDEKLKIALVGSSNLTGGGQKKNIEANVLLEIEDSNDVVEKIFEQDIKNFFNYLWDTGKEPSPEIIKKYAKAEQAKNHARRTRDNVPNTTLSNFVFINNKREIAGSLSVQCTDCRRAYVDIPLNAFYCDNCGNYPSVDGPEPLSAEENHKKKEMTNIWLKINGKELQAQEFALRCPDCHLPVDMTDEFMLWIICKKCADIRKKDDRPVCQPYKEWSIKAAKEIWYGLKEDRLRVDWGTSPTSTRYKKFLGQIPIILGESPMKMRQIQQRIQAHFPLECDDAEKCTHRGRASKQSEWKHLVRSAAEELTRQKTIFYDKTTTTYRLK